MTRTAFLTLAVAALLALAAISLGCAPAGPAAPAPGTVALRLKVETSDNTAVDMRITTGDGGPATGATATPTAAGTPWSSSVTVKPDTAFRLSAQRAVRATGWVTCTVTASDGTVLITDHHRGPYAAVLCTGDAR